jgi:hypothetical protein
VSIAYAVISLPVLSGKYVRMETRTVRYVLIAMCFSTERSSSSLESEDGICEKP